MNKRFYLPLSMSLLLCGALTVYAASRDDVVAVLSGNLEPYHIAQQSFEKEFGSDVRVVVLGEEEFKARGQPRVVVAFGGKAALLNYPAGSALVYCMAPGTVVGFGQSHGVAIQIAMMPEPAVTLSRLQEIQPSIKRLAVIWKSPAYESYVRALRHEAKEPLTVQSFKLDDQTSLPVALRRLANEADALFVPSDPLLMNKQNLVIITQFSNSVKIPIYSTITGLAEQGAVATISVDYEEIGRRAAEATRSILQGGSPSFEVYPDRVQVIINLPAAQDAGFTPGPEVLQKAQKVLR